MPGPSVTINTYGDSLTGHTNVTFRDAAGNHVGTWGANISFGQSNLPGSLGGVYSENPNRVPTYTHELQLPEDAYNRALFHARWRADETQKGLGEYSPLLSNCYDFVDDVLTSAGLPNNSAWNYMEPGSLVHGYGAMQEFLMNPNFWPMFYQMQNDPNYIPISHHELQHAKHITETNVRFFRDGQEIKDRAQRTEDETWASPIVIDLEGNGIRGIDIAKSKVVFDFVGNGRQVKTAWLDAEDAFLVHDENGNGVADGIGELFGGRLVGEAFDRLRQLDENIDSFLDSEDVAFSQLGVWRDFNSDGKSTADEISSLLEVGITRLSLNSERVSEITGDVAVLEAASARMNGEDVRMVDVFFRTAGRMEASRQRSQGDDAASTQLAATDSTTAEVLSAMSEFLYVGASTHHATSLEFLPVTSII